VGFLQQLTCLGDELGDFERLHEIRDVVLLQESALIAGAVGEREQDVAFHAGTIFFEPLVGLVGVPVAWRFAVQESLGAGNRLFRYELSGEIR
jgi:hypothetical protein